LPARPVLVFYWGVGCSHCDEAKPVLEAIAREHAGLRVAKVEIRQDAAGRARYLADVARLGIAAPGIPLFVVGDEYVLGYSRGPTEVALREIARRAAEGASRAGIAAEELVDVPLLGRVEARRVPLGALTVAVALADGLNPCAIWVLVVLLGVLAGVRSRSRLLLFGGAFVAVSGLVYFAFMIAWSSLFVALGGSPAVTRALGVALVAMGLVNVKELFFFRRGISLTIPARAKPGLYRRIRAVVNASSLPAALAGVLALAFLANLVELGCTAGLPALYTRVLSLRDVGAGQRLAWLAAYNALYVVPLAIVVAVWAIASPRSRLGERGVRALKGLSGTLLLVAGAVLLAAPQLLG
jgi:thiol-disulfide isomerase/thioredoxin